MALLKPKFTLSSVRGRIIVSAEDGERVGQWGGTECFLSRQTGMGPCLVVRSSRHKRHQGTFFRLVGLQSVLSSYAVEGKLTVVIPHQQRMCTVFIETSVDVDELRIMAAILQDREHWKDLQKNVACKKSHRGQAVAVRGTPRHISIDDYMAMNNYNNAVDEDGGKGYASDGSSNNSPARSTGGELSGARKDGTREIASLLTAQPTNELTFNSNSGPPHAQQLAGSSTKTASEISSVNWTSEQKRATDLVRGGKNVFVTGSAGTGKTEWLLHLVRHVLPRDEGTAVTATTGIAARMLGGSTVHAFSGIGRAEGGFERVYERVRCRPEVVRAWRQCNILVIDEIGVLTPEVFSLLDAIARRVRRVPDKPFGGIQLILLGDFLQLPPVNPMRMRAVESTMEQENVGHDGVEAPKWCFECPVWEELRLVPVEFRKNYRHEGDAQFAQCMEDIRFGRYTRRVERMMSACLSHKKINRYGLEPTVLVARREEASAYNTMHLNQLDDAYFHRYESEDYAGTPGMDLDKEVSLQQRLELRVGAQVVLLAPLPSSPYLSNGDRGVVVSFVQQARGPALPVVCFASKEGEEAVVPPVRMEVLGPDGRVVASRTQVPLQLAWAMTVHRVQGMTLPLVSVRLNSSFFDFGQAYVALTRARCREDVLLTGFDPSAIRADPRAVAFYTKTFPDRHLPLEKDADSELVEVRRGEKRARSPAGSGNSARHSTDVARVNDGAAWWASSQQESQLSTHTPFVMGPLKQAKDVSLAHLPVTTGNTMSQFTQGSEGSQLHSHAFPFSQNTLMLDDD
ncbi:AAA domain [Trypanosoma vivax]|uniref:ATP-dependent DNA helicase n=1 Tax=Trypanosoma vivax (strain Y486) TaxID=1055687 RepID=G0U588_TRYVY|nr:putative DNA repair and recombination protein,mitochondrial precursor [Trypanosoma vivax]KAH8616618.1 AAA domain [Trypanosoma vivax]CCC51036.1 putative DNA repair and recombination protein,mitochondrial precursor [Trypanosoma vivax Y486]